jgi:hypothetical protein
MVCASTSALLGQANRQEDAVRQYKARVYADVAGTTRPAKTEKAAFLGVACSSVNQAMREQLQLRKGVGLIVNSVVKDSPAEAAGMKQYDILEKLDEQWLINSQQLSGLVRSYNPGDTVKLAIIRQGQRQTVEAKLVEREVAMVDEDVLIGSSFSLPDGTFSVAGMPGELDVDRILKLMNTHQMRIATGPIQKLNNQTLTLTVRDGKMHLVVTDQNGNKTYDGPIDTPEQRQGLPQDIKGVVEHLMQRAGHIQINVETEKRLGTDGQ